MAKNSNKTVSKIARNTVPILGIRVDSTRREEALNCAWGFVSSKTEANSSLDRRVSKLIVTPNPEILSRAYSDPKLAEILNKADLSVPDGIGTVAAMRFLSLPLPDNKALRLLALILEAKLVVLATIFSQRWLKSDSDVVPGRLIALDLVKLCAKSKKKVFLLGGSPGSAELASRNLIKHYKFQISNLKFSQGPWLNNDGKPVDAKQQKIEDVVVNEIRSFKPDLLLVGFGAPKQEKWLGRNLSKLNVSTAMVVGGMIDYTAGVLHPAPRAFSEAGFEWLWRLICQPHRIGRILTAVFVFPSQVFIWKLKS